MAHALRQQHFSCYDDLKPMIHAWASRFVSDQSEAAALVDRTVIEASSGLDTLPEMPLDRALFCLMHRILLKDAKRDARRLSCATDFDARKAC
jgi:DNA-directed RNA polymerase specialized sigma24 family protein